MINPAKRRRTNLDNIETDPKTPNALLLLSVLSGINSGKKLAFPSSFPIHFLSICHLTLTEFLSNNIFLQFKTSYLLERPYLLSSSIQYSFIIIHVLSNGLRRTNLKTVLIGLPIFTPILYLFHSISCTCFIPSEWFFASHQTKLFRASCAFPSNQMSNKSVKLRGFPICDVYLCYTGIVKVYFISVISFHCPSFALTSIFIKYNSLFSQCRLQTVPFFYATVKLQPSFSRARIYDCVFLYFLYYNMIVCVFCT